MEYKVVYGTAIYSAPSVAILELEEEVKKLIKEGFKPQGGISVYQSGAGCITAYQAMIKE